MELQRKKPRYIVGIDLGTTNTVAAYTKALHMDYFKENDLSETQARPETDNDQAEIKLFKILQFTGGKTLEKRDALPSFLYILQDDESFDANLKLPWEKSNTLITGEFARERGVELPHKLVSSSKSWLCNHNVDRESPILPYETPLNGEKSGKEENKKKISPVEASCAILSHIKNAWNHEMAGDDPDLKLENQDIYLTVPASFDAVARQLTIKAAEMAGLENPVLIEEPQAAFYSWINRSGEKWRKTIKKGDLVLVCDIGGGTSDFSLIEVKEGNDGNLELERLAVGDHLLVGGDNIDLALTYYLKAELEKKSKKLDSWQMRALVHSSRKAKETLCSGEGKDKYPVTILGRGRGLIKGTIKTKLKYTDIETILFNGFFPQCSLNDRPAVSTNAGMKEFGLAYESDPAITRHLAKFISSCVDENGKTRLPTAVVFNGGVMKSPVLRKRVMDIIRSWAEDVKPSPFSDQEHSDEHPNNFSQTDQIKEEYATDAESKTMPDETAVKTGKGKIHEINEIRKIHEISEIREIPQIREIKDMDFDFSVAKGAACYGLAVNGKGIRIRAGLGRSYYMAVETAMPAVPGLVPPTRALCIAPFGMEEGSETECSNRIFNLVVGHKVNFDIMTSSVRKQDSLGVLIDNWEEKEINELSSIGTLLEGESGMMIPVTFKVKLTETGILEFWAYERDGERKWKFELNIRSNAE